MRDIVSDILTWSWFSEPHGYNFNGHLIRDPGGNICVALAPDLSDTYRRLRADFVRRWVAQPQRILPYTAMPVNIPYKTDSPHFGGVNQNLYSGTSIQQLDAVVDFLMNFDVYTKRQAAITPLVNAAAKRAAAQAEAGVGGE